MGSSGDFFLIGNSNHSYKEIDNFDAIDGKEQERKMKTYHNDWN